MVNRLSSVCKRFTVVWLPLACLFVTADSASGLFLDDGPVDGVMWPGFVEVTPVPVCFRAIGTQEFDDDGNLKYTVDYTMSEWLVLRDRVQRVAERTWERWSEVDFTGWGVCTANLSYTIYVDLVNSAVGGAGNAVPKGSKTSGTRLWMKLGNITSDRKDNVIIHEFGHALGFHHEKDRPAAFYATDPDPIPKCIDGAVLEDDGVYLTSFYDDASIMSYCNPSRASLSYGDIIGVQTAYDSSNEGVWLSAMPAVLALSM